MKFTVELEIPLSFLLQTLCHELRLIARRKLIAVGGPSDRTAIAGAAFEIPEAESAPAHSSP
jgi:hypothetical protein